MKQKKSVEDYLKVILVLSRQKGVHGSDIAAMLKVSRPTVSVALKALEEEGYLYMDGMHEVHLTEKGKQIAEDTCERHDVFTQLLMGFGVDEETASADACEMEHRVSPESYEVLRSLVREGKEKDQSVTENGSEKL